MLFEHHGMVYSDSGHACAALATTVQIVANTTICGRHRLTTRLRACYVFDARFSSSRIPSLSWRLTAFDSEKSSIPKQLIIRFFLSDFLLPTFVGVSVCRLFAALPLPLVVLRWRARSTRGSGSKLLFRVLIGDDKFRCSFGDRSPSKTRREVTKTLSALSHASSAPRPDMTYRRHNRTRHNRRPAGNFRSYGNKRTGTPTPHTQKRGQQQQQQQHH